MIYTIFQLELGQLNITSRIQKYVKIDFPKIALNFHHIKLWSNFNQNLTN